MEPKGSRAIVGLFVLLLGVGVVATTLWLAGFGRGATKRYLVYMKESVSGLAKDSVVKYRGVEVGHVSRIGILPDDPETIVLTLEIEPSTPIREDTKAQLELIGLTGLAAINLLGGSREAPPLLRKQGQRYPVIESAPSLMSRLETNVLTLMETLSASSDRLASVLGAIDADGLARTLASLERLSESLAARSDEFEQGVADASRFFSSAADASERLPELVDQIETLTNEWSAASADVRELAVTGQGETHALSGDLHNLVRRLDRVIEELEADPSVLLHGRGVGDPGPGE